VRIKQIKPSRYNVTQEGYRDKRKKGSLEKFPNPTVEKFPKPTVEIRELVFTGGNRGNWIG
jgi:hypothetical protein